MVILLRDVEARVGENDIAGLQRLCNEVVPEILDLIDVAADVVNAHQSGGNLGSEKLFCADTNPKQRRSTRSSTRPSPDTR